jgi:hypothetical protein
VQFTIGPETHERLRRLQALLRREIPDGDPGAIFDLAVTLLLEKVEKTKLGAAARPRSSRRIRPGTDKPAPRSRAVARAVKRATWRRDAGQCAFVSPTDDGAPSGPSWSSTMFSPMRNRDRPRSGTSPFTVGDTTNTQPN